MLSPIMTAADYITHHNKNIVIFDVTLIFFQAVAPPIGFRRRQTYYYDCIGWQWNFIHFPTSPFLESRRIHLCENILREGKQ